MLSKTKFANTFVELIHVLQRHRSNFFKVKFFSKGLRQRWVCLVYGISTKSFHQSSKKIGDLFGNITRYFVSTSIFWANKNTLMYNFTFHIHKIMIKLQVQQMHPRKVFTKSQLNHVQKTFFIDLKCVLQSKVLPLLSHCTIQEAFCKNIPSQKSERVTKEIWQVILWTVFAQLAA